MQKIKVLILTGVLTVACMGVGCGNKSDGDVGKSNVAIVTENIYDKLDDITENNASNEAKLLDKWMSRVAKNANYERDFDVDSISRVQAQSVIDSISEMKYVIYGIKNDKILAGFYASNGNRTGIIGFYVTSDGLKASYANEFEEWCNSLKCSKCDGAGSYVVSSHVENSRYACGICNGTGWVLQQFYNGSAWQNQQVGCSGCGGAGWLNGNHTVNDYETCKKCKGLGMMIED